MEENRLYNFMDGLQLDVNLVDKDGEDVDIMQFLDNVSLWTEKHPEVIKEKYLPFSCVAVGLPPIQASAFLYGCFVGRAMEKAGIKVKTDKAIIDKKELATKVKENINKQIKWFQKLRNQISDVEDKEKKEDDQV
jgi:hypothetical protein